MRDQLAAAVACALLARACKTVPVRLNRLLEMGGVFRKSQTQRENSLRAEHIHTRRAYKRGPPPAKESHPGQEITLRRSILRTGSNLAYMSMDDTFDPARGTLFANGSCCPGCEKNAPRRTVAQQCNICTINLSLL